MAQLALRLPIFLACSQDAAPLRDMLAEVIRDVAVQEAAKLGLLIEPRHWESHALPGVGAPQENIDHLLRSAELVVCVVRDSVGDGLVYELDLARKLAAAGDIDRIFVYFQQRPASAAAAPASPAEQLRKQLESTRQLFPWPFHAADDLCAKFRHHLCGWLAGWPEILGICEHGLRHSGPLAPPHTFDGENKIQRLRNTWSFHGASEVEPALGRLAIAHYQSTGGDIRQPITRDALATLPDLSAAWSDVQAPADQLAPVLASSPSRLAATPLIRSADGVPFFGGLEWYWYFCAVGLRAAILDDQSPCTEQVPYVNPVHQYLRALFAHGGLDVASARLTGWLLSARSKPKPPITRNFAAYVLGMLEAHEAQDALAEGLKDTGLDVRRYCITSLGKLRSRRHLQTLTAQFAKEAAPDMRLLIAQAICRTVGVADYPL